MKSNSLLDISISDMLQSGNTLYHFTGNANSTMTMSSNGDFAQTSTNIVRFTNLSGANLENIFTTNTTISFINSANDSFYGVVNTVSNATSTIVLKNNVWLSILNVARGSAVNNTINISNVYTSSYNLFNNGNYSSNNPIVDIIQVGDFIKLNNEVKLVTSINYTTKILTLANNFTYSNTGNISVNKVFAATAANVQIVKPNAAGYT